MLTGLSRYWFDETAAIVPNHLLWTTVSTDGLPDGPIAAGGLPSRRAARPADGLPPRRRAAGRARRSRLPLRLGLEGVPGHRRGLRRPLCRPGLRESDRLPEPILTPATKARARRARHQHRRRVDGPAPRRLGADRRRLAGRGRGASARGRVRETAHRLYERGAARCAAAGIVLADTKFEMGLIDGELALVDEVLTPDSSRFWDAASYAPGRPAGELRQAVRAGLARRAGLGQGARPGRSCRRTWSRARGRATSRRSSGSPARASSATCATT